MGLPVVKSEIALLVAPSLNNVRSLRVDVEEVKCDGLYRLFDACRCVNEASFAIIDNTDVENALDCIARLVDVAWKKDTLRKMNITFMAFDNGEWDDGAKEQYKTGIPAVVQKMRLRRCKVVINKTTY